MRIERASPRAHLVLDEFFAPETLDSVFREISSLGRRMGPGLVRDYGHDGQSVFFEDARRRNQAVWIHDPSKLLTLFRERMEALGPWFEGAREPLFQIIPRCGSPNLQVSRYMTGDHYDFHEDEGAGVNLTAIVFLAKRPEKIRGGDLVLAYGGEQTTVRFRHNRLVVFPSKTLHRVTRVRVDSNDPEDARISLQSWLAYGRPADKKAKAKKGRVGRPAEADRPTFLLAEEPILAAAQSLLGSPEGAEQTPEELYWGAFYLTRILTQNLRALAGAAGIVLGPIRVRRSESGEDLEVYGRARRDRGGAALRVGFSLKSAVAPPSEALQLFVETGRGPTRTTSQRLLAPGADEKQGLALLRRLLKDVSS